MGLFSSKKKTKVYTTVQRMIEDNQLPHSATSAIIKYIMEEGSSVSNYVLNHMLESIALRAERMYEYAAKGKYAYGLPAAQVSTRLQAKTVVQQVISAIQGVPITLDYYRFAPLNNLHTGWKALIEQYGYDPATNEIQSLSQLKGTPVYLDDMLAVYSAQTLEEADPDALVTWGLSPRAGYTPERLGQRTPVLAKQVAFSPFEVDPTSLVDYVRIIGVFRNKSGSLEKTTLRVDVVDSSPTGDGDYHQVRYTYLANGVEKVGYWTYLQGSGDYPEIDSSYRIDYEDLGTYFPWIYYRHDKQNRVAEAYQGTEAFKSSVKLCNYLGLDYQQIGEAVHENPDIGDVEQAMTIMAVPANTTEPVEIRYLYEYFSLLLVNRPQDTRYSIDIRDREFRMIVKTDSIVRRKVAGKSGPINTFTQGRGTDQYEQVYRDLEGQQNIRLITRPYHFYRKQVSRNTMDEIRVYNLQVSYDIWRSKKVTASTSSEKLLIPLDRSVTGLFSLADREQLFARSLHNIFNTRITTKTKWYQSGWFKVVMVVVAVVLTIVYPPGGAAMWATIAAMGTVYLALAVIGTIIMQLAISYAVQLFAEAVGAEWAMVVAVALAVYGGYQVLSKAGSLSLEAVKAATANAFVKLGTSLAKASLQQHQLDRYVEYNKEVQQFELFKETKIAELEEVSKLLDTNGMIDPFEFIGEVPMVAWGESPKDYYERTVHSGNIGVLTLDVPGSYVTNSLALPTFQHTVTGWSTPEEGA